jgi:methyl-accepting chemotaxis protein
MAKLTAEEARQIMGLLEEISAGLKEISADSRVVSSMLQENSERINVIAEGKMPNPKAFMKQLSHNLGPTRWINPAYRE